MITPDHASSKPGNWHAQPAGDVEQALQTQASGLTEDEARERVARFGQNRLIQARRQSAVVRLFRQFHNILLYVMMASTVITALLGHWLDAGVLLAAVIINAFIGFIQEGKAESAMDAIHSMLSPRAMVLREGHRREIDATDLVPGDQVLLASGDRVPADLRLIEAKELRVEESALTGESLPVDKLTGPVALDASLGDRHCMAYSGTVVVHGQARGVVVAIGTHTELGRINQLLSTIRGMTTPLLRQVDHFGRVLALAILALSGLLFVMGTWWLGHPPEEMFMMVVALAASAIPEGLPAILTVTLALGVQRMARRQAIVRRLSAVEALGSVTVICSDKTGTLTRNEMTVQRVVCARVVIDVDGVGYEPLGECSIDGRPVHPVDYPSLEMAIRAGVLCNDAVLRKEAGIWHIEGDPTEGALLVLGAKVGLTQSTGQQEWPRRDSIPFESEHRFMATYHETVQHEPWIFIKGAPEQVLDMCDAQADCDGLPQALDVDYWRRMATDTAAKGLRVLGLACKRTGLQGTTLGFEDVEGGFTMLALVGMMDPPRAEAIAAVMECHRAGIQVKMITGDHAETARAIGTQLDIGVGKPTVTGAEVALMDDVTLRAMVMGVDVYARASPEHKLRLVQAMQAQSQVVSMTGDGVNDAPALKRADIGVAMGLKGTEAAKEAADVVLADDNFATIAAAVREGRTVYDNLKKFVLFMLPTNGGEGLLVISAILFQFTLPLTPAQVLWINLVTSSTLGLALAFEPAEKGIMQRRPRPSGEPLLSLLFVQRVLVVSVLMMAGALGLFLWELSNGMPVERARTMTVNAVVTAEMFYLINSRHIYDSVLNREGLFGNRYVWVAIVACIALQVTYTYTPFMHSVFDSAPLGWREWVNVLGAGLLVFTGAELEKWLMRHWRVRRA